MLKITIPSIELYDEESETFTSSKEQTLVLEHSLVSLSRWESKWHKPFLTKEPKTVEETIDYIKCMTTTQNVDDSVCKFVTSIIVLLHLLGKHVLISASLLLILKTI